MTKNKKNSFTGQNLGYTTAQQAAEALQMTREQAIAALRSLDAKKRQESVESRSEAECEQPCDEQE